MGDILFLAHRMPAPDGCVEAARGYHVLKHLAARHRVHFVALTDDASDAGRKGNLVALTASREVLWRSERPGGLLGGVLPGGDCLVGHFHDPRIRGAVVRLLRERMIDTVHVMGSQMAQHVPAHARARLVVDFMKPASERLLEIAGSLSGPARLVARRRARVLRQHERQVVERADASLFADERFARSLAGSASADRLYVAANGIDADHFSPEARFRRIEATGPLIFVAGGTRNPVVARALAWLADAVMPHVRILFPQARLVVAHDGQARADRPDIVRVDAADLRPWLALASVVVAPGESEDAVYNALQGMTMGRPVVATSAVARNLDHADSLRIADGVTQVSDAILWALENHHHAAGQGAEARLLMARRYPWEICLAPVSWAMRAPLR